MEVLLWDVDELIYLMVRAVYAGFVENKKVNGTKMVRWNVSFMDFRYSNTYLITNIETDIEHLKCCKTRIRYTKTVSSNTTNLHV